MPTSASCGPDIRVCNPTVEQGALLIEGESTTAECAGLLGRQALRRLDEHDVLGASETEELAQHRQSPLAGFGQDGEESLDVMDLGQCPLVLASIRDQEADKITHD